MELKFSLKTARLYAEMTQQEAADKLGVSKSILQMWESGSIKPKAIHVKGMASLYNVPEDSIFLPEDGSLSTIK